MKIIATMIHDVLCNCRESYSTRYLVLMCFSPFRITQTYIARFGHGSAKLARQAQSKEKTLGKMVAGGLTEKVESDKVSRKFFLESLLFYFLLVFLVFFFVQNMAIPLG